MPLYEWAARVASKNHKDVMFLPVFRHVQLAGIGGSGGKRSGVGKILE